MVSNIILDFVWNFVGSQKGILDSLRMSIFGHHINKLH